ncbi:DMT family transporter [Hyphomicrobium sp. ghe19]|uniref:DMT family transporter n=1 Tax=Hyphomicrobium sp. ghe19 TaxID=2682968 RepID=UPI0030CEFA15
MSTADWGTLVMLSVLWGFSFIFAKVALHELPVFLFVALRVVLAGITLVCLLKFGGAQLSVPRAARTAVIFMGILNCVIPFCLFVWSQKYISAGLASILNATTPLIAIVLAHFTTQDEKITRCRLLGTAIGIGGVIVVVGAAALKGAKSDALAQMACIVGAFSYALAGVYGRRLENMGVSPMSAATGQVVASAFFLVPLSIVIDRPWELALPSLATWGAIAGAAVLSTALAYILYFRLLATAGATNMLLVALLVPISAIILGAVLLDERLQTRQYVGALIVVAGLAVVDGRLPSYMAKRSMLIAGSTQR